MIRVSVPWSLSVLALTTLVALTPVHAQDRYTVTDLGRFLPADVNDAGSLAGIFGFPLSRAARRLLLGDPILLDSESSAPFSTAMALNELETLVGATGLSQAFRWTQASGLEFLDTDLASVISSTAWGVNAAETIVGCANTGAGSRPVVWVSGQRLDLATLGGARGCARAINAAGDSVGWSWTTSDIAQATLWPAAGGAIALTPTACATSEALDLTPDGTVVGICTPPGLMRQHMFRWTAVDGMQDLGVLPGHVASAALGVNAAGVIVGTSFDDDVNRSMRAVRWQSGLLEDLNTLLDTPGWLLISSAAINNQGWIVGVGIFEDTTHGYLLIPVPAPVPAPESEPEQECELESPGHRGGHRPWQARQHREARQGRAVGPAH